MGVFLFQFQLVAPFPAAPRRVIKALHLLGALHLKAPQTTAD
jgi:hypothetical protein